jgi:fructose-1-phosphate kinase PfkB-like protein
MLLLPLASAVVTANPMIIAVVGLNAALQKRLIIPNGSLIPGNVHRISSVEYGIGGKGQDVAVTLSCLQQQQGSPFQIRVAQFLGVDSAGDQVYEMMQQLAGVEQSLTVRVQAPLRVCTSIVAEDSTTELVEPSGTIQPEEIQALMNKLLKHPSSSTGAITTAKGLCIMGSLPPGCSEASTYADIYQRIANEETLTVVDSVVSGIFELPLTSPTVFKINASELCRLTNVHPADHHNQHPKPSETDGVSTETVVAAIKVFLQKCSHHHGNKMDLRHIWGVAVTDGAHAATLAVRRNNVASSSSSEYDVYQFSIPNLNISFESVQNQKRQLYTIGAGDAVAAALLAAWLILFHPEEEHDGQNHPFQSFIKALHDYMENIEREKDPIHSIQSTRILVTAFAFALCCGSASCLQSQNSVVDIHQVLELFSKQPAPAHLHPKTIIL